MLLQSEDIRAVRTLYVAGWDNLLSYGCRLGSNDLRFIGGLLAADILMRFLRSAYVVDETPLLNIKWVRETNGTLRRLDPPKPKEMKVNWSIAKDYALNTHLNPDKKGE